LHLLLGHLEVFLADVDVQDQPGDVLVDLIAPDDNGAVGKRLNNININNVLHNVFYD